MRDARRSTPRRAIALACGGVALLAIALYARSIGYAFVRDDHDLIVRNPLMRADGGLARLLGSDFFAGSGIASGLWRPLVLLSFWVDGRVSGFEPWLFHSWNVLMHAAVSAGVVLIAWRAGASLLASALAGAWFAAMPVHVESVAWISGRTDLYAAAGVVAAWLLDRRSRLWASIAFALALFAKESALVFLPLVALQRWIDGRGLRSAPPYLAVAVLYAVLHALFVSPFHAQAWMTGTAVEQARWTGWTMLPRYVAMLWPGFGHAPDLALRLVSGAKDPAVIVGMAMTLVSVVVAIVLAWRRSALAVPFAWFVLPVLMLVALSVRNGYLTFGERLLYLSTIGAAWLLALAIDALASRSRQLRIGAIAGAAFLVATSAYVTIRIVPDWRSDLTVFEAILRVQPDHARARVGYAGELADLGREEEAIAQLALADRSDPRLPEIPGQRAAIAARHSDWRTVQVEARRALERDPENLQARLLLANACIRLRDVPAALTQTELLMQVHGEHPAVWSARGQALLLAGDPASAVELLERAFRAGPGDPMTGNALAAAASATGRLELAREALISVLRTDPSWDEGRIRLAEVEARIRADSLGH